MQQKYIDILFQLQCCIANLAYNLVKSDEIGASCSQKDSDVLNELVMYLRTLKRQNIVNLQCLTLDQIKSIIEKINKHCEICCLELNKLKI